VAAKAANEGGRREDRAGPEEQCAVPKETDLRRRTDEDEREKTRTRLAEGERDPTPTAIPPLVLRWTRLGESERSQMKRQCECRRVQPDVLLSAEAAARASMAVVDVAV